MSQWWDPKGPAAALHTLNPVRSLFVRRFASHVLGVERHSLQPLAGVTVLDVGCGGGLLSESLARLGGTVTGLDASTAAVEAAEHHARASGFAADTLRYRLGTPEELGSTERFDLIVCSEVVEHVADAQALFSRLAALCNGRVGCVVSTINRTAASYAAAIVLGEYVMRLVPAGTHDWDKFVTPLEMKTTFSAAGMRMHSLQGLVYNPLWQPTWRLSNVLTDVNYIAAFQSKS